MPGMAASSKIFENISLPSNQFEVVEYEEDTDYITNSEATSYWDYEHCTAPLKSQVFEWARKKGYDTKVQKESEGLYFGFYWTRAAWVIVGNGSYEEAESACIDKLIELLK